MADDHAAALRWIRVDGLVLFNAEEQVCLAAVLDISKHKRDVLELQQRINRFTLQFQRFQELWREQINEMKIAKAKTDTAENAKKIFMSTISHELLTPLHAVSGYNEILRNNVHEPAMAGFIEKQAHAAQQLTSIIHTVLDLTQFDMGQLDLEYTQLTVGDIVYPVQAEFMLQAERKGLNIKILAEDTGLFAQPLQGDLGRLRQLLVNFLDNTVKFSDQGDILLSVTALEKNNYGLHLKFEVQDFGIGIAEQDIPGLFDAFSQVEDIATRMHGGIGVGLAINKSLANIMGGEVGVKSRLGQGSTFWFIVRLKWSELARPLTTK